MIFFFSSFFKKKQKKKTQGPDEQIQHELFGIKHQYSLVRSVASLTDKCYDRER